ncbi:HNH endonuclease signature motif containing protein [Actinomadura sp. HBU206391]|uniref:HNH endonuclease signature motif containing protein n=1 Tax=Actinomadura sp. HBU206391 TaxID=2731692 RepID=UPI00165007C9|nr:HNH endonuclease signature motif containing protein [Actinomadura sp. HBU206391]MBC6457212.1 DUF222 domain-containing protein [Actinomadura sp. HBU206391]
MIEQESSQPLPVGLAEMPPGPALGAALASIDRSALSGFDLVVLLQARSRQLAFEQAELAADMVAVSERVRVESSRLSHVWDSDIEGLAAAEIAAALRWTRRSALARLQEAWGLVERLPAVWAALATGSIDLPRARVLLEGTGAVPEQLARRIAAQILPQAPSLTTGQLAHRLRKLVLEADPDAARERYEGGVAERKVVRGLNADGTGYLSGCNLPADRAAAADERLDALARAAKQAGDDRPIDQIRADVYLDLISGTYAGPGPVHRRGVVELTADLPTLMGLAERAGELAGWGPVIADVARQIAATRTSDGETIWRFSITDPFTGRLLHHGTTRPPERQAWRDPRRAPTRRQRAFVIARDRTCRGPGCRVPASRSEIDHRLDHAKGGPTKVWNLDAECGHCHDLKDLGWTPRRNAFDDMKWTSLLGHTHHVPAQPLTPPKALSPLQEHFLHTIRMRN